MKMVKSLLLGTATGLVAVAGAQAADLPVKAKPVQYVKICSLYGAGFYYIPGTDMCLKMGGWVRFEAADPTNNSSTGSWSADANNRSTSNMWYRARGYLTADARNQSAYGTIRSYIAVGLSTSSVTPSGSNAANQFDANRAFVQFAGFTFGRTQSFYDFYSAPATTYVGWLPSSDTGDGGWEAAAYTAQFGGGLSASISAENRRMTQIIRQADAGTANGSAGGVIGATTFSTTGSTANGAGVYGGWQVPDIVANLRLDQAWGSAQIMGALHEVNATYYSTTDGSGHPGDKWGFVVGAGAKILFPSIGPGDYLQAQVNYTQGAVRYLGHAQFGGNYTLQNGATSAMGILADGVYGGTVAGGNTTGVDLTTAWGVNAAYEHFWNTAWRTSLYGGYEGFRYNTEANAMLCSLEGGGNGAGTGNAAVATAGCNNNWSLWYVGSRTQWNITPDTYLGLDVAYGRLQGMSTFNGLAYTGEAPTSSTCSASPAANGCTTGNNNIWTARFRVHRDFYP
jgi:hypothetical protein